MKWLRLRVLLKRSPLHAPKRNKNQRLLHTLSGKLLLYGWIRLAVLFNFKSLRPL